MSHIVEEPEEVYYEEAFFSQEEAVDYGTDRPEQYIPQTEQYFTQEVRKQD